MITTNGRHPCRSRTGKRRGFTLAEVFISVVSTSALLAGIASSIMIASRAAATTNVSNSKVTASMAIADMVSELTVAKSFSERTSTAITFQVADRDGDFNDETIRYVWSGQIGSSLLRYYNGASTNAIDDVYSFSLAYTTQAPVMKKKVLFVRGNVTGNQALYDRSRRDLMNSWGYQVVPFVITASTLQADIDAYLSVVDAVYISSTATPADVGTKFNAATVGVLIEHAQLFDDFKIYANSGDTYTEDEVKVDINTHPITSAFAVGKIKVVDSNSTLNYFNDATLLAPGVVKLCRQPSGNLYSLVALEKGGTLRDGTSAPGRRVTMPWGASSFDASLISGDGEKLYQAALAWASYNQVVTGVDITIQSTWSGTAKFVTRAEFVGKPVL